MSGGSSRPEPDVHSHQNGRLVPPRAAIQLIAQLEAEEIRTKVQQPTSGPHKGGISFKRGSLFHLLANSIYCAKIVHQGKVFDG
jgi:hypothetical protein